MRLRSSVENAIALHCSPERFVIDERHVKRKTRFLLLGVARCARCVWNGSSAGGEVTTDEPGAAQIGTVAADERANHHPVT
jgi:hypothetical protein